MNNRVEFFNKIKNWLANKSDIKAAILVGSDARVDHPSDKYSDYDIEIYTDEFVNYVQDEKWLGKFGNIWVNVRDKTDEGFPTCLVIYEESIKVDFSLRPVSYLTKLIKTGFLPNYYQQGYEFLSDRDSYKETYRALNFAPNAKDLDTKEFRRVIEEFWFEIWHIAKYLKRNDLWVVKFRDGCAKEFLLKMIEWHAKSINGVNFNTWHQGRFMKEWTDEHTWNDLKTCFSQFDAESSWKALLSTMNVFRRLAKETAQNLKYQYPEKVDLFISQWVDARYKCQ